MPMGAAVSAPETALHAIGGKEGHDALSAAKVNVSKPPNCARWTDTAPARRPVFVDKVGNMTAGISTQRADGRKRRLQTLSVPLGKISTSRLLAVTRGLCQSIDHSPARRLQK